MLSELRQSHVCRSRRTSNDRLSARDLGVACKSLLVVHAASPKKGMVPQTRSFRNRDNLANAMTLSRRPCSAFYRVATAISLPIPLPTTPSKRLPHPAATLVKSAACAPVAQMDRVAASEAAGRWFESNRARHFKTRTYARSGPPRAPRRVTAPRSPVNPTSAMPNRSDPARRGRTGRRSGCGRRS